MCFLFTPDDGSTSPLGGSSDSITPKTVIRSLRKASDDKGIKAIVLRIDSPGKKSASIYLLSPLKLSDGLNAVSSDKFLVNLYH